MLRLIWLAQIPRAHPNNFPGCGFLSLRSRSFSEWVCNDFLGVIFQQGDGKCVWSKKVFYRTSDVLRYCEVTKMAAVEMRRLLMLLLSLTAAAFVPKIIPRHAIISQKLVFRSLSLGLHSAGNVHWYRTIKNSHLNWIVHSDNDFILWTKFIVMVQKWPHFSCFLTCFDRLRRYWNRVLFCQVAQPI